MLNIQCKNYKELLGNEKFVLPIQLNGFASFNSLFTSKILLIQVILQDDDSQCLNTQFQQPYDQNIFSFYYIETSVGYKRSADMQIFKAEQELQSVSVPDISFTAGSFKFTFTDVAFTTLDLPPTSARLDPDQDAIYLAYSNINFTLSFQFQLKQQHYPYASDSGSGTIYIQNAQFVSYIQELINPDCQGSEMVNLYDFSLLINQLVIQLESPLSYLYDGILSLITDELIDMFNNELQSILVQVLQNTANGMIESDYTFGFPNGIDQSSVQDQRIVDVQITELYDYTSYIGTMCYYENNQCLTNYTLTEQNNQQLNAFTNDDRQFFMNKAVLESMFYQISGRELDQNQVKDKPCDNVSFVKLGFIFTCYYDDDQYVQYVSNMIPQINLINNKYQEIQFKIQDVKVVKQSENITQEQSQLYQQSINQAISITSPGFNDGVGIDIEQCYNIVWTDRWMEFSCNYQQ